MDFDLNDEQRQLKDSVDRLIAEQYGFEQRRRHGQSAEGWSREMWARYSELGLLGLPFAERHGGSGAGAVETMIVMEAIGRGLVLEPYLATVVLAGGCLRLAGSDATLSRLAPAIASGELLLAFAHAEADSRYDLAAVGARARRDADGWLLEGTKSFVLHGDSADQLIVSARISGGKRDRDGIGLFLVDARSAGLSRRGYRIQDGTRAAEIMLDGVRVGSRAVIGEPGGALPVIERVVDAAIAAVCAEAVGAMDVVREATLEYLKTRRQFGVAIGAFQALQHRAVDMLVAFEQAKSMAMYATILSDESDAAVRRRSIAAARVQIGRSSRFIGQQGIQLHGGIGMTLEYRIGHYFRRLTTMEAFFGDTDHHLAELARTGPLV